jgi:hypothetical protein
MWPFKTKQPEHIDEIGPLRGQVQQLGGKLAFPRKTYPDKTPGPYTGNDYPTYAAQVRQLGAMYNAVADWGSQTARAVLILRAAFTIGGGIALRPSPAYEDADIEREMDFARRFLRWNDLDDHRLQKWAVSAEIEGKLLAALIPNPDAYIDGVRGNVDARYISWRRHEYKITTPANDYAVYNEARYHIDASEENPLIVLRPPYFTFRPFGGEEDDVNEPTPRCGAVIQEMENLSRIRVDWRRSNAYYASPTPVFTAADGQTPAQLRAGLTEDDGHGGKINWTIGRVVYLGHGAKLEYVNLSGSGQESLKSEAINAAKNISTQTGVPIHFLGHAELMGQGRATADTLLNLLVSATNFERKAAGAFYSDLIRNAMLVMNDRMQMGYREDAIGVEVPIISEGRMEDIRENWLPLYLAGIVPIDTVLEQIPDIDVEAIKEQMAEQGDEIGTLAGMKIRRDGSETSDPLLDTEVDA